MKSLICAILLMIITPLSGMAENGISQTAEITDATLLGLMIGFILLLLIIIQALAKSIEGVAKSQTPKQKNSAKTAKAITTFLMLGASSQLSASPNTSETSPFVMSNELFWLLLSLIVFLSIVVGLLFRSLLTLIKLSRGEEHEEEEVEVESSVFKSIGLTDNVPIEEEETVMMDHEYDGIRELDNNLPPWWKYMFYATILFAIVYLIRFHITGDGKLSHEEYAAEIEAAEAQKAEFMANTEDLVTEDNVELLIDESELAKGEAIYKGNCATCHGQLGEGGAGPNLTDAYWIHGGGISKVFSTIKYGVPEKGMIAWQTQFSPTQMQEVASYVISLQGSNPPNAKDPEGELYEE